MRQTILQVFSMQSDALTQLTHFSNEEATVLSAKTRWESASGVSGASVCQALVSQPLPQPTPTPAPLLHRRIPCDQPDTR
jgi:hypothetical protein